MKIRRTMSNEVTPHELFGMMCLQEYQEQKCRDAGALSYDVSITVTGHGAIIKARRKLPTHGFPGLLRKFVPSGVTSTETIEWGPADDGGARTATLHVDFHGAPASMKGTVRIEPDGVLTHVHVDADFSAHVPLVGGKIENIAAPIIIGVIDAEEETGRVWVASSR